jgi:predicted unusual protein kinase regulating ubiquinone biosynthesis (AarF/ABC1/UbiB family)
VAVDASSGRSPVLLFYDFGMMGQIVPNVRERLLDVFYGIYRCEHKHDTVIANQGYAEGCQLQAEIAGSWA